MQNKPCLNQKELARRWTISHRTLESWRTARKGPAYMKIGCRVVYRLEDIVAFERVHLQRVKPRLTRNAA